jgi:2-isopropylmalate synthase
MEPQVEIFDTTLRDGSQGEGINFSVSDKLRIAEKLDAFGIDYIEGGWPGSNPKDSEFFKQARERRFKHARLAAFGSTRRTGTPVEDDEQVRLLLAAETPVVAVFGKTWLLHVRRVLRASPEENLRLIRDTVSYLKDRGKFVVYDAEHAFKGWKDDPEYALATWRAAEAGGADVVVLCDTNGGSLPEDIRQATEFAASRLKARLGIHTHDDIGLGVANALSGLAAGATHVQGTINGYGERIGNCNLTTLLPILVLKLGRACLPEGSLARLRELSQFVDEVANVRHDPRQPWVGRAAFVHKGGVHVSAVQRVAEAYEHADPAAVGNVRRVLVSDLAGRSNITVKAQELGFKLTRDMPELKAILAQVKQLEHEGYEFEAAEASLALLIRKTMAQSAAPFTVQAYHVSMRREGETSVCEATVKVRMGKQVAHTVADGDGPVNALDSALRAALLRFYPQLEKVRLTDYKVRILNSDTGTAAKTRVLIESSDGEGSWDTVGVSENIIDASLQALVDSIEYALLRR